MDLHSSYPFWLIKEGLIHSYPSLEDNKDTEVVIIGAGITGALMAYYLGKAGIKVIMVDKRHVGMGSTCASTGLLQYEIDTPLHKLISMVGEANAVRSYELCVQAIKRIHELIQTIGAEVDFETKPSFQYASSRNHVKDLRKEFELRKQFKLSEVAWLEAADVKRKFSFAAPAGLLSTDGAQVNAYKLTHCLLTYCGQHFDLQVYDTTEVVKFITTHKGIELKMRAGQRIKAKKLIVCAGYESENYLSKKVEIRNSTYAIISKIMTAEHFWYEDSLIWETAMPYLYMRTTKEHRVLVGGHDDKFYNPEKRDRKLKSKAKQLVQDLKRKFPHIPFEMDFAWAGTFCGTKDGLPYIGNVADRPNTYFSLGFGGNGITFSLIAAEIICDVLQGKANSDTAIFSFGR